MATARQYRYRWKSLRFGVMMIALITVTVVKMARGDAQTPVPATTAATAATTANAKLFLQQCGACHSTKAGEVRVGPSLAGIMGKVAGKQPGFTYSDALKRSSMKWNAATLDRWLADSSAAVKGSIMNYRQADAAKRKAIIAYMASTSGKSGK
ncbi:MAG: c-type cytochrome [Sphingomonadales bacterium]|nr:MAG: c-type cytochrome [Sphingomonadales bacterium]TNF05496.1 MAG: c-type cytochrome [Sphingomonadales bacterium]